MIAALWALIGGVRGAAVLAVVGLGLWWHFDAVTEARREGALSERLVWQEKQRRLDIKVAADRDAAQAKLESAEIALINALAANAITEADLDAALKQDEADNAEKNAGACRAALPGGVRDALNRIGR